MIFVNLDLSAILKVGEELEGKAREVLSDALKDLSTQAHAHIVERVNEKLHSTRQKYIEALRFQQVSEDTWMVTLEPSALWIEEGIEPNKEMLDDLLKSSKAKMAKDGCVLNPRNKVLTNFGWKPIAKINPGDLVLTHSGKFREVKGLAIKETPIGTKYTIIKPYSFGPTRNKKNCELVNPSFSLTDDHLVLTIDGWRPAGQLKKNDLIATPADIERSCICCGAPLPLNAFTIKHCLNNKCARQTAYKEGRVLNFTEEKRRENALKGNAMAKKMGIFAGPNWGARNPQVLAVLRKASATAMRSRISSGKWEPEVFFEKCLEKEGLQLGEIGRAHV